MTKLILSAYGLNEETLKVELFGSGLINSTWKVTTPQKQYILQRVNNNVFQQPHSIAHNICLIADYLSKHHPEYKFVAPVTSIDGCEMIYREGEGFFRLFPFVPGAHSIDVVKSADEAYEAALQFGRFTKLLSGFDSTQLQTTIPRFHDLTLRYEQFLTALENGNKQRIDIAGALIKTLLAHSDIMTAYNNIKSNPLFKLRVTHHDTKISNVLFNSEGKGLCVIDLDTVMPGYFISDVGDMMRTYLSPVSEEETDFNKIEVRSDFYKAIVQGYFDEMKDELTSVEKEHFFYAGTFMIYMQSIRFLTNYINDDKYYEAKYPEHNLVRAQNQAVLLQRLIEKKSVLQNI